MIDIKDHGNVGMAQLDKLLVNRVAPKQDWLSLRREFITGVSRRVTMQGNELHPVQQRLGVAERVPLAGIEVRGGNAARAQEELLCIFRRFGGDFRRQPKITLGL